ncbi:MAG: carbohydrate kinase family protein [Gemmatimonadetes bacterium]|nr:carbohydrate kinase family protein [Gemmatimonadota bacterium]
MTARRVGVIGSFVWDRIYGRDSRDAPVEEWGGITYALSAFDAALPEGWEVVPLVKVGADLERQARAYLGTLRRLAPDAQPIIVTQANNRVTLRYLDAERRTETLSGGVPAWSWLGLKPLLAGLDALYVNLMSGWELDLETALLMRQHLRIPIYADLHSLLLGVNPDGLRTPRRLSPEEVVGWCRCFDFVQVNEDEMALMASDPMALAATAMAHGVRALTVTLGPRGAVFVAAPGFDSLADLRPGLRRDVSLTAASSGAVRTALVPAQAVLDNGGLDPTGCGDVWGATYFSRLLGGDRIVTSMQAAHAAAARNVRHRGATGLAHHLRGELGTP